MSNNQSPTAYGQEYGSTLRNRWSSAFGLAVRRMTPIVWPGVPPEAFLGFTSIAGSMNAGSVNTADPPVLNSFAEIGYFQTEAGERGQTAPAPDVNAHYNNWGKLHDDQLVIRALGHAASMVPNAWKQLPEDQAAVGLVNLRHYVTALAGLLPAAAKPTRYDTMYAVAMAFTAFSAGTNGARQLFTKYATQLASVPEVQRWQQLVYLLAKDIQNGFQPPGGAGRHGNVAYDALRTMQKFEAGRQLALSTGGNAQWFDMGMGAAQVNEEAVIQRAAYGEPISGIASLSAPVLRAASSGVAKVVAGLGLLALAGALLIPKTRKNPDEDLIRRIRQMIGFGLSPKEIVATLGKKYPRDEVYLAYHAARLADRKNPTPPTLRRRDVGTAPTQPDWSDTIHSAGRYRVMKAGDTSPCKSCKAPTRTAALSEESGERGYSFTPVCARHLPELRARYDEAGYVEHHRENPRSYDHEKLLLAVSNHRDAPPGLVSMSYEELYKVARRLRIRS